MSSLPKCTFSYKTLKAIVGNSYKGYETLDCVQVPKYTKLIYERTDEGGGWYGAKEWVEHTFNRNFIIIKDNKPFGVLLWPYDENIKSDIYPLDHNFHKEVKDFIQSLITY